MQYGNDTARAISHIIKTGAATYGEAFNFAQDELITMEDYVKSIQQAMGLPVGQIEFRQDAPQVGLPSALFGALNTSKAARVLTGWKPTPMPEFIERTVNWWSANPAPKPNKMPDDVWEAYQRKQLKATQHSKHSDL